MKKSYILIVFMSVLLIINSCRTKDGSPGPAGPSDLINQGSISGTLSYLDSNGDSVGVPFNYQYYATLQNNQFTYAGLKTSSSGYVVNLSRRSTSDADDSTSFYILCPLDSLGRPTSPTNSNYSTVSASFSIMENLKNNLFSFQANDPYVTSSQYNSNMTITNFSLDTLSGSLKFNYVLTFGSGAINYGVRVDNTTSAIIKGSVNVILIRNKYGYVPCTTGC